MSAWLEEAAGQQSTKLKNLTGPPQPTIFNFIPDDDREVRAILKTVGRVSDVTLSLVCPSTSEVYNEMIIQVNAKNMEGKCIAVEEAEKSQLPVEVTAPNNDVIPQYRLTSSSSSPSLVARYRPIVTGQYKVSATVHGKHLKGRAAEVKVHYHLDTFDPAKCPPSLVLSNNNLTVKKTRVHGSACVLGTRRYITGQHDINLRLDGVLSNIDAEIGVTSNEKRPLEDQAHTPDLTIWHTGLTSYYGGRSVALDMSTDVGQPWQSGDLISLHMDCDQHTVTLTHRRSGKSHTAVNVTGFLRLFVCLYHRKEKVSIIP